MYETLPQSQPPIEELLKHLFPSSENLTLNESDRAQALLKVEMWLQGLDQSEPHLETLTERQRFLEKKWIVLERERMRSEERETVLTPRQEEMLVWLEREVRDKQGAGVLVSGVPGTGKSVFLKMLADRLLAFRSNGLSRVTAQPMSTSADMVGVKTPDARKLFSTTVIEQLSAITSLPNPEDQKVALVRLIAAIVEEEVNPFIDDLTQERKSIAIADYLKEIGVFSQELYQHPDIGGLWAAGLENVLSQVIRLESMHEVLDVMSRTFSQQEQREKLADLEHVNPGHVAEAATKGHILIVEEADKMALDNFVKFGWGLEEILQSKAGQVVKTAHGITLTIHEGFLMLVSANDLSKIPDNIQRRFKMVDFNTNIQDLIWQARVLLSDDSGESLLRDRPQDEHDLARFILWWEALGRSVDIAFNSNVLYDLCTKIKAGLSFKNALDEVIRGLESKFQPIFLHYLQKGEKDLVDFDLETDDSSNVLKLADLNWTANKRFFGGTEMTQTTVQGEKVRQLVEQPAKTDTAPVFVSIDDQELILGAAFQENSFNYQYSPVAKYDLTELKLGGADLVASSADGQSALLRTDQGISMVDMPTGQVMKISLPALSETGVSAKTEWGNGVELVKGFWKDENNGIMLVRSADKGHELVTFAKGLNKAGKDGAVFVPEIVIRHRQRLKAPNSQSSAPNVSFGSNAVLVTWGNSENNTVYSYRAESLTQPLERLRDQSKVSQIVEGQLGTFLVKNVEQGLDATWLKT